MTKRTRDDIQYVAELARLRISKDEIDTRLSEFNDIVDYIELLNELSTDDIEPTFQVRSGEENLGTPMASDESQPSLPPEEVVKNAPTKQDSFFVVPRVIDEEGK